jgi:hypothetical protein
MSLRGLIFDRLERAWYKVCLSRENRGRRSRMRGNWEDSARKSAQRSQHLEHFRLVAERWKQPLDMLLVLMGAFWFLFTLVAAFSLNDYLRRVGQLGLLPEFSGTWGFLILFSLLITTYFCLPSLLYRGLRLFALDESDANWLFWVSASTAPLVMLCNQWSFSGEDTLVVLMIIAIIYALSTSYWRKLSIADAFCRWLTAMAGILLVIVHAVLTFAAVGDSAPNWLQWAVLLFVIMLFLISYFAGNLATWCAAIVSGVISSYLIGPAGLIMLALYHANLGGGIPAQPLTSPDQGRVCNLGVSERPILYKVEQPCTISDARKRLVELEQAGNDHERAKLVHRWQQEVDDLRAKLTPQNGGPRTPEVRYTPVNASNGRL